MTRRTAIFLAAALASMTVLPAMSSAAPQRAPGVRVRQGESAVDYARRAEVAMNAAKHRIESKAERSRMSVQQRSKLTNDLNVALQTLRHRIAQRGGDGWITPQENQDVQGLHAAIRSELGKTHGALDSWQLL